jgi:phospholipid-binding lipoprotein MlaA
MKPHRLPASGSTARLVAVTCLVLLLGACTSIKPDNPRDPFEPFNRNMSEFNERLDSVILKPSAIIYRRSVPALVRTGVSNVFSNLADAWTAVNSLLQFRLQAAEESFARFHLNTMFGVFGIFDVASEFNIERHREDFGQTLGRWGVPPGPYVVLPFLGPSTLRDTFALPIDRRGDLVRELPTGTQRNSAYLLRAVDARANLLRLGNVIEEAALDKYSFTRDAYLQRRNAEIFGNPQKDSDGEEPRYDLPADIRSNPTQPRSDVSPAPDSSSAAAELPQPFVVPGTAEPREIASTLPPQPPGITDR